MNQEYMQQGIQNDDVQAGYDWRQSLPPYIVLVAAMAVLSVLQMVLPAAVHQGQQMSWIPVLATAVFGLVGLLMAPKAGFPAMWDSSVSSGQRFLVPFAGGLALGVVMVLLDLISPLGTDIQTIFPDSLLVFPLAGLVEEVAVHLFFTTFLLWLVSYIILNDRYQETVFWIAAVAVGLVYWLLQVSTIMTRFPEKFSIILAAQLLLVIATTITAGAYFYRRSGFLAALSLRYGFYLVWHIIWAGGIGVVRFLM